MKTLYRDDTEHDVEYVLKSEADAEIASLKEEIDRLRGPWPQERRFQFDQLRDLVREAGSLNNGSHVIQRMQRIEMLCCDLHKTDFMHWLHEQCVGSR